MSVLKNFEYSLSPLAEKVEWTDPLVTGDAKCDLSVESNLFKFKARIGPLERASTADLWKNIPFLSSFLSIDPNTLVKSSTFEIKTGVL